MILLLYTDGKNSILHKTFNVYALMKRYTSSLFPEFRSIPSKRVGPGVFPSAAQPLFVPLVPVSENFSLTQGPSGVPWNNRPQKALSSRIPDRKFIAAPCPSIRRAAPDRSIIRNENILF